MTYRILLDLINKYIKDGELEEKKEDLMNKLDIFLLADRITGPQYKELQSKIEGE